MVFPYTLTVIIASSSTWPSRMKNARTGFGAAGNGEMMKYAWFG